MYTLTVILHIIVCFLMIAAILLQAGKGAEIGASFGGSSQTVFGSRGPGTFLSKITVGAAIVFMLTSLSLALLSKQANTSSTVIDLHPTSHHESPSPSTPAATPSTETNATEPAPETTADPTTP
ncbi:preprotein translocase subunit SecG [uncultured Nitrospira sp.]|uniref:preprotein translocase subunit SecG n=1 Tax=uncultured Nitrospira sp. TaxID=157176 RepID=UPI0031404BCC